MSINEPVEISGIAFESPLPHSGVVEKVDFQNKELLIFCDDTDCDLHSV